jgi:hypothetical protein
VLDEQLRMKELARKKQSKQQSTIKQNKRIGHLSMTPIPLKHKSHTACFSNTTTTKTATRSHIQQQQSKTKTLRRANSFDSADALRDYLFLKELNYAVYNRTQKLQQQQSQPQQPQQHSWLSPRRVFTTTAIHNNGATQPFQMIGSPRQRRKGGGWRHSRKSFPPQPSNNNKQIT